ncbi:MULTISPECIES: GGDEF domain-containing protein [unclassified Microbacterium]|uniref:GGDEF domain-containing protein n=1 Tax=unclassified Microbacterium TaxID=2609290 RepID=UPI00214CD18E|nr:MULTISPECIES: GGDEF domain-containing protein [unclassified Microbacterium]MCR2785829.1 GGDEF domain-containing protein [Microbacterium sp. zg.B96]MDL5350053.1 GGDEF domain-containing protein [Microbacterium sp. zg-YB36]WIM17192.1 GGDEF domain-containing protein [Microbacterium sp. zg-B96]
MTAEGYLAAITALVVIVCGVLFIAETFLRRDDAAGRLWALGFLSAMLTTLSYLVWASDPGAVWAVAAGNGTFVSATGFMWLGCRRFNERSMRIPAVLVAAASVAAIVSVIVAGPDGGGWAGALWMFTPLCLFAMAAAVETRRGSMRRATNATMLTLVFALQSAFYLGRIIVFVAAGPESPVFSVWLGTVPASSLTVILMITSVVATSVLRATRTGLRGRTLLPADGGSLRDIQPAAVFARTLDEVVKAARRHGDHVAVLVIRLEELEYIATAFGLELADQLIAAGRDAVRRGAPPLAVVGDDGDERLAVIATVRSAGEARRLGMTLYRELFDAFNAVSGGVLPSLGVGVSVTSASRQDPDALLQDARTAAARAASSAASAVLVADASA